MKKLSQELSKFVSDRSVESEDRRLSRREKRLFRSLKTMGERATRGREIENCLYEVRFNGSMSVLLMILEGRHALSVGHQVGKGFQEHRELKFVDVVKTRNGAKVVLRPNGEEE